VQSDHLVIELNMKIKTWRPSKQGRRNANITKTKKTKIDYKVLKEHPEKQEACDEAITRFIIEKNPSYPDLAEHIIVEQYKKVATRNIDERQYWFQENKTALLKNTEERNDAQCELTKKTTTENREKLQGRREALKKEKRNGKHEMATQACNRMQG
jgi:hypothetical protein